MSQAIIEARAKALFEYCQMDGKSLICAYARDDLDPKDAHILIVGDGRIVTSLCLGLLDSVNDEIKDPEARAEVLDAIKTGILKKFK